MQTIQPRFSYYLLIIFLMLYTSAYFCLWYANIALFLKLSVSILLVISAWLTAKQHLFLRAKKSITAIRWGQHTLEIFSCAGHDAVEIAADSIVTRYLMILNFKVLLTGERKTLLLLPDSLSADLSRQLRVRLFNT